MDATDILVIGGGPAGYIAALKAARLGATVRLVEARQVGGTCLNRGCIPAKTFLRGAEIVSAVAQAASRGILLADTAFRVDLEKAVAEKNAVVGKLVNGIRSLLKASKVELVEGEAVLTGPLEARCGDQVLKAAKAVIAAGGSVPARPPIPGADDPRVMTSDEILDLTVLPQSLVIVGAGVIGLELAQVFHAYGTQVTLVEAMETIAPFMDAELSRTLRLSLARRGIAFHLGAQVAGIDAAPAALTVRLADGSAIPAERVLIATGRRPDTRLFGELPVEKNRGFAVVNDRMETSIPGLFAPGDINGLSMLAHAADKMGEVAAVNALGGDARFDRAAVPGCIYGFPEAGWIGLTEAQAKEKGAVAIGKYPFTANGRALASGHAEGFVKVLADPESDRILGVHMIGPCASDLINEASVAMAAGITAHAWAETLHAHPTHAEVMREAAAAASGSCLNLPPPRK